VTRPCFVYSDQKNGSVIIVQLSTNHRSYLTCNFAKEQLSIRCLVLNATSCGLIGNRFAISTFTRFCYRSWNPESSSRPFWIIKWFSWIDRVSIARVVNIQGYASVIKRLSRQRVQIRYTRELNWKWRHRDLFHLNKDARYSVIWILKLFCHLFYLYWFF